jgi:hypothetical protein
MSEEEKAELRLEIAHVLFIDILVTHISVIQKFLGAYGARTRNLRRDRAAL